MNCLPEVRRGPRRKKNDETQTLLANQGTTNERAPTCRTIAPVSGHAGTQHRILQAIHHGEDYAPFTRWQPGDRLALEQALDAPTKLGDALAAVVITCDELLLQFWFELIEPTAQFCIDSENAALVLAEDQCRTVDEEPTADFISVRESRVLNISIGGKASVANAVLQVRFGRARMLLRTLPWSPCRRPRTEPSRVRAPPCPPS